MKQRYRLFRRNGGVYYTFDNDTKKQYSLNTKDKREAIRLLHARNEAQIQPQINIQIARAYLMASDPGITKRTWQYVMEEMKKCKKGVTKERWERAVKEKPFDRIRKLNLLETRPESFLAVLASGTVSTNIFLRRMHNFALDMNWLPAPIIPRRQWPKIEFKSKRGITVEEHEEILADERNPEWHAYYEMLWHLGGSQSDIAMLRAEDIDWNAGTISYNRMKTKAPVIVRCGKKVLEILKTMPKQGPLFPMLCLWPETDRAKAFIRRCARVGVSGVSLHSYRYAWAERAKTAGMPERFAMEIFGHNSKAVTRAYAKKAQVKIPSLVQYERRMVEENVVVVDFDTPKSTEDVAIHFAYVFASVRQKSTE